jgi:hypothetical protein
MQVPAVVTIGLLLFTLLVINANTPAAATTEDTQSGKASEKQIGKFGRALMEQGRLDQYLYGELGPKILKDGDILHSATSSTSLITVFIIDYKDNLYRCNILYTSNTECRPLIFE